jgi:hypothetical protein
MTNTKRTTVRLDSDTAAYIKWKTRGAGYQDGNTMKKIINDGIRCAIEEDSLYQEEMIKERQYHDR